MKDSIELLARFAYQPNALKYCGPSEANRVLRRYIMFKDNADEAKQVLLKFEALKAYLGYFAERTGKDYFDYDVVASYCIGNSLIDNFTRNDLVEIVKRLKLIPDMESRLIQNIPSCVPHHSFNVIHIGVGAITGSVKTCIENMSKCLVMWAKVKQVYSDELVVSSQDLEFTDKYWLGFYTDKKVKYDKEMLSVSVGDIVATHWDFVTMKLDNDEVDKLKEYTLRNIAAINLNSI